MVALEALAVAAWTMTKAVCGVLVGAWAWTQLTKGPNDDTDT